MLELRPACEHCQRPLPPDSAEARICSFECTFCAECAEGLLAGVCPNCGGDFVRRPIRPRQAWCSGASLAEHPAAATAKHRPVDLERHGELLRRLAGRPAPAR
jgi:hypothetical protein